MDYKQEFVRYKHVLYGTYKSKRFLTWFKKRFPYADMHHLLMRQIDYLAMPFEHGFHLNVVHKNRQKYFCLYLKKSMDILIQYAKEELNLNIEVPAELTPEIVKGIIEQIWKEENKC